MFGIAGGMTYYAALYYAMVMKNAAVEAGGAHEGLIGSGLMVGPVIGLGAVYLSGSDSTTSISSFALTATIVPFLVVCTAGALRSLKGARHTEHFHFPD